MGLTKPDVEDSSKEMIKSLLLFYGRFVYICINTLT